MSVFLLLASFYAAIGVTLGAFGAHALKNRFTPERLQTFETGVRYQMYHVAGRLGAITPLGGFAFIVGWVLLAFAGFF